MSIDNFKLNLNHLQAPKYNLRNSPLKYPLSDLRPFRFEQSEGIRPAEYFAPEKYLPVSFMDKTTEDWIVIPKGRIVSAVPIGGPSIVIGEGINGTSTVDGEPILTPEILSANIDNSYFGYDNHINNALVLANGGTEVDIAYTADDVTAGTLLADETYASELSDPYTIAANIPIGVAFHDWYQDIRGKSLNYKMHPDGGHVLCDWFVEVPYIKIESEGAGYSNPQFVPGAPDAFRLINNIFSYLVIKPGETPRIGTYISSDLIGNYEIQGDAIDQAKNCQTVGKLMALDNRWPKDSLQEVMQYPGTGVSGITTAGLPRYLFDFVYANMLIANGTRPTIEDVYDEMKKDIFGIARIQLLIA